jgi:hypothetical protein
MGAVPDGYERFGEQGLKLIDPIVCPAGHPFRWGQSGSLARCAKHGDHNVWICACSQWIWRYDGAFVGEKPPCLSSPT